MVYPLIVQPSTPINMNTEIPFNELFENAINFPNPDYLERYRGLVGLEESKLRIEKILSLLVNPEKFSTWVNSHHSDAKSIVNYVLRRPPLIVFEGDVGSGKTELALTVGDSLARKDRIDVTLLPLSLTTRGQGMVGQMTKLITAAIDHTIIMAKKLKNDSKSSRGAIILLIDEADALAQSREISQMHHEDRAGVNALIRGIDRIANEKIPAAIIMSTNRINSLDPAIKRRAAEIIKFNRPTEKQRFQALQTPLLELGLTEENVQEITKLTGPNEKNEYGFTYSDLIQRLLPAIILDAYPDRAVTAESALAVARHLIPTKPFSE